MYPMYHNDFRNKILAGVMALALLSMAAGGLLLWKNRRGTPGEPVGLYHRLLCDGLALERQYIRQDAKDYPRQVLVVDLSGSILTEEEKTEVLERIEADWPMLEVVDYPAESSDQTFHGRFDDDRSYEIGGETLTLDGSVQLYYLSHRFLEPFPPREELGINPVPVLVQMEMGGYQGCPITYIHRPRRGWVERERGAVWAHS